MTEQELPLPDEALSNPIAIVGTIGSGKTVAAKGIVEQLLARRRRVCIIDPTGAWWGLRSSLSGKEPGLPVIIFGGDHADIQIDDSKGRVLARLIAEQDLQCLIDISRFTSAERIRFCEVFFRDLHHRNERALHLIVDETDEVAPQNPMPEARRMLHEFDRIVRRGRIRGFRVMMITQRPAVLAKNVLSQSKTLIAMLLTAPQDRNALEAWIQGQADADQAKEVMGSLAKQQRGQGWIWGPPFGILKQHQFPMIWTFDSSRTPKDDEVIEPPTALAEVDLGDLARVVGPAVVDEWYEEEAPASRAAAAEAAAAKDVTVPVTAPAATKNGRTTKANLPTPGDSKKELKAEYDRGFGEGEIVGYNKGVEDLDKLQKEAWADGYQSAVLDIQSAFVTAVRDRNPLGAGSHRRGSCRHRRGLRSPAWSLLLLREGAD